MFRNFESWVNFTKVGGGGERGKAHNSNRSVTDGAFPDVVEGTTGNR